MKNIFPEIIAICVVAFIGIENPNLQLVFSLYWGTALILRFGWNSAILIHELGHAVAISTIDRDRQSALRINNISDLLKAGNNPNTLSSLIPGAPIFIPFIPGIKHDDYPSIPAGDAVPWRIRLKAIAGISFNLLAAAIAFVVCSNNLSLPYFLDFLVKFLPLPIY